MNMKTIVIIGGGASGLMAACCLPHNIKVIILEQHSKVGKKILASGNGRCNFTNLDNNENYYNNKEFVKPTLNRLGVRHTLNFFESRGLMYIVDEEKRVYPYSNNANTIREIIINEIQAKGVDIKLKTKVTDIKNTAQGYKIICDNNTIKADYVIISKGGIVDTSSKMNNYDLFQSLNHTIIEPKPALVPIKTSRTSVAGLEGLRVKALVKLIQNDKVIREEVGEVLFKKDGLSGIVIFNLSLIYQRLNNQNDCSISLDLTPHMSQDDLVNRYYTLKLPLSLYLNGIFNPKLSKTILTQAKNSHKIEHIITKIKDLKFKINGCYNFENAQISIGGINTNEINNITFESKLHPNLYILGEAMDIDAECGGHNLQWAFSTGFATAYHLSTKFKTIK